MNASFFRKHVCKFEIRTSWIICILSDERHIPHQNAVCYSISSHQSVECDRFGCRRMTSLTENFWFAGNKTSFGIILWPIDGLLFIWSGKKLDERGLFQYYAPAILALKGRESIKKFENHWLSAWILDSIDRNLLLPLVGHRVADRKEIGAAISRQIIW